MDITDELRKRALAEITTSIMRHWVGKGSAIDKEHVERLAEKTYNMNITAAARSWARIVQNNTEHSAAMVKISSRAAAQAKKTADEALQHFKANMTGALQNFGLSPATSDALLAAITTS